jgi:pimeloyl-ACP methyl ester carboxylesterase
MGAPSVGRSDIALDSEMVEKSLAFCAPGMCKATYFDDATHWVQHDEPEKVAHLLTSFLRS